MICMKVQLQTCLSLLLARPRQGCTFTAADAAFVIHALLLSGSFCKLYQMAKVSFDLQETILQTNCGRAAASDPRGWDPRGRY